MQPVTFAQHRDKYWHRYANFKFSAGYHTVYIVASEISRAALTMPLAFIRKGDGYTLCVVLSPTPEKNIYIAPDGRWLGGYIPASVRSYPFSLEINADKDETLCVDESSGLIQEGDTGKSIPLFDDSGKLSEAVQQVLNLLHQVEQNRVLTDQAVSVLSQADVICEWDFKLTLNGVERSASGLYRIDETRLSNLADPQFVQLRQTGALKVAYAQLLSMGNISKWARLAKMHNQSPSTSPAASFSLGSDDMFQFGEGSD